MGLNDKKKSSFELSKDQKKMLPAVLIPLAVIVLIMFIVLSDKKQAEPVSARSETAVESVEDGAGTDDQAEDSDGEGESTADEGESADDQESTAEGEDGETEAQNFETEDLKKDSVPEILSLMKTYFQARANADASALNQVYGGSEKEEWQLQKEASKLRSNSKYVQGFENVTTYVTDGPESDTWLVYAVADIRFNSVKTTAPMIMWCCVQKDSEGNYHILKDDAISDEMQKLVDTENHSEGVRRLASSVNTKLKDAIESDEDLKTVYGVLRDGSPVYEGSENQQSVVVESDNQSTESSESGADAAGDSAGDATTTTDSAANSSETSGADSASGEGSAESGSAQ